MWARRRLEWVTAGSAVVLGVAYLLLPLMGSDLSAQVARADFFADHGYTPIDLRWYGGVNQFGYSLVSQPVMALLGVRVTGAHRAGRWRRSRSPCCCGAPRRRGRCSARWSGRCASPATWCPAGSRTRWVSPSGCSALLALTVPQAALGRGRRPPLLASATSPVAGLFLGLAGVRAAGFPPDPRRPAVAVPAAIPLALTAGLFGDGGWMNIGRTDALRAIVTSLIVAVLVPRRPVRVGALLSAAGVLAAVLIHTPVGLNATRLVDDVRPAGAGRLRGQPSAASRLGAQRPGRTRCRKSACRRGRSPWC